MSSPDPAAAPPPAAPSPSPTPARADNGRRTDWVRQLLVSALAILLALVVGAVLVIVSDPQVTATYSYFFARPTDALSASFTAVADAYRALFLGAFGGMNQLRETVVQTTPLLCAGLGVTLAFRAGLFNIGAQGQLIAGAFFAAWAGFGLHLPPFVHMLLAVAAGILGGALWGGLVGLLKARTGAHEVITTIMLNYVAANLLGWMLMTSTFQQPGSDNPISPYVDQTAMYPGVNGWSVGSLVALAAVGLVWWLLERSTLGFELRAVGANPDAARTAGMSVGRTYVMAMLIAGGLAGLAGTQMVLGRGLQLTDGIAGTIGFDAITVALLGRGTPLGTLGAAILFGALAAGSTQMEAATGTPVTLTIVLQATIVLLVAAPALVRSIFRIRTGRSGGLLAKGWNG
ncbi:MAG TPA: ABC transporter permease [Actinopolymorphaceae bacterium]